MAAGRGTHMEERPVLILADYGRVELTLRELMEQRGVSRNQLAKLINVRFEVVNKWFGTTPGSQRVEVCSTTDQTL